MGVFHWLTGHWLDVLATAWLLLSWCGYAWFARRKARDTYCIASVLHAYRKQWMAAMLKRDNRIADASLLANLERNASFLASTAILVIAGLVTILASVEKVHAMLQNVPLAQPNLSLEQLQFKVVVLLLIFVYAFFTFTWAMRQYGFCAVLVGAAPYFDEPEAQGRLGENFVRHSAKVIDQAGHTYNYGLRAFYFSLAVLAWLVNTWFFAVMVALVVAVLYAREFHSRTLRSLIAVGSLQDKDISVLHD